MNKYLFSLVFCFIISKVNNAQVKIGDNSSSINSSAVFELESGNKGFLLPRLSSSQINLMSSPAKGLILFNTTDSSLYVRLDTGWVKLLQGTNDWLTNSNNIYNANIGNIGIGTTMPQQKLHVAGSVKIDNSIYLPSTTASNIGVIYKGGEPFLHNAGNQDQQNVYLGRNAGSFNTFAKKNVAIGEQALASSDGADNIAIGYAAAQILAGGGTLTDSYKNLFLGYLCGQLATGGINNIAIGNEAGLRLATGSNGNVVIGSGTGSSLQSGSGNCLIGNGVQAGSAVSFNTGIGGNSGISFVSGGGYNTWIGANSLQQMLSGTYNTALGANAGKDDTTGNYNVYIGAFSGNNRQGTSNVFVGSFAASNETTGIINNTLVINNSSSTTHLINGDFNTGKVGIKKTLASLNYTLDVGGEIRTNPLFTSINGADGVFYYNANLAKFSAYENGSWKDLINDKMKTKAGDPITSDIPVGNFGVWKNTNNSNVYLWVNDGGVLKKVQLQ